MLSRGIVRRFGELISEAEREIIEGIKDGRIETESSITDRFLNEIENVFPEEKHDVKTTQQPFCQHTIRCAHIVSLCTFWKPRMVVGFRLLAEIFSGFIFFFLYCFITPRAVPREFCAQVPLKLGEADVPFTGRTLFIWQNSITLLKL